MGGWFAWLVLAAAIAWALYYGQDCLDRGGIPTSFGCAARLK
jgi:hypothetical protein